MAAVGRTARGLRRVPGYRQPEPPRPRRPEPPQEAPKRRRPVRYKLFSLGAGLDMPLLIFTLVLLAIGLVMLFSASYASSYYLQGNSYYYISRQAVFAVFGVAAMLVISTFDYHSFHKLAIVIFGISLFLLVFLLICRYAHIESIADWEGDATRWLNFGIVSFQPSEIAKFGLIVMLAHMISQNLDRMDTFRYGVVPYVAIIGLFAALIFLESHLSATLIILALGAIMMFVGGTKPRWFVIGGILVAAVLLFLVISKGGYQLGRIIGWLDPFSSDLPEGVDTYQTRQSLYAIGSGGLLGVGLGQSRQKYLYLPAPQNDFIFAVVCEELGLVGALVIIVLFALLIWRGVYVSIHAKDKFGMLLGLGITFQIGLQAVLNICVVTNTIPNTGIALPFFSYGGTALLMLLGEMGILLNISRSSNIEKT